MCDIKGMSFKKQLPKPFKHNEFQNNLFVYEPTTCVMENLPSVKITHVTRILVCGVSSDESRLLEGLRWILLSVAPKLD